MNFKPTWLKSIVSIIIGFVLGSIIFLATPWVWAPPLGASDLKNRIMFWVVEIITIIVIYLIWSLLQKK